MAKNKKSSQTNTEKTIYPTKNSPYSIPKTYANSPPPPKRKNVSQTIPLGRTIQTRDEYLGPDNKDYRKPGYENKGYYRAAVIVDSNRAGDLAVVKLTTSNKGKTIPDRTKSKYRPFVETKDEEDNPIRIGKKFKENPPKNDLSKKAVSEIKRRTFRKSSEAKDNRDKVRELKNRPKK
ncbi:MAG: hypothetical protein J6B04_05595 [Clostridia bacterium]|nr:hypothetical protein [Clostridia bacterium]